AEWGASWRTRRDGIRCNGQPRRQPMLVFSALPQGPDFLPGRYRWTVPRQSRREESWQVKLISAAKSSSCNPPRVMLGVVLAKGQGSRCESALHCCPAGQQTRITCFLKEVARGFPHAAFVRLGCWCSGVLSDGLGLRSFKADGDGQARRSSCRTSAGR